MKILISIFFILIASISFSQDEAEAPIELEDTTKTHSVKKSVILSACLPGAGQVYNHMAMPKGKKKAFWKVPLIYAALGTTGYFLISNQITQRELKNEYIFREDFGTFNDPQWASYDDQGILTLRQQHLNMRDLSILAFGAVYILQVVDAGVEAHFVNFDVSEDLSLSINPIYSHKNFTGLSVRLNFR